MRCGEGLDEVGGRAGVGLDEVEGWGLLGGKSAVTAELLVHTHNSE